MCTNASFSYGFSNHPNGTNWKIASFSMWETWQKTLAGGDEEQILPCCQSTTCIVMLWHFKHLECTLCFEASSFPQEENYQSTQRAAVAWRLVRRVCDCKVASLTPQTIWEYVRWGSRMRNTLSSPQQLLLKCPYVRFSKLSSGNSLVIVGSSHQMRLSLCGESPRCIIGNMLFISLPGMKFKRE